MYIRRTQTRNTATGERYYTHRLVRSERTAEGKVRPITLLNLGRHFPVAQEQGPVLCARIEQLLSAQSELEREAQRCAGQYLAQHGQARKEPTAGQSGQAPEVQAVDVDSLTLAFPRSVGVEQVGLWAMRAASGLCPFWKSWA
jgi:hypothetical protein